jgi:hypothetical protein
MHDESKEPIKRNREGQPLEKINGKKDERGEKRLDRAQDVEKDQEKGQDGDQGALVKDKPRDFYVRAVLRYRHWNLMIQSTRHASLLIIEETKNSRHAHGRVASSWGHWRRTSRRVVER